jgi:hypothetical protein
MRHDAYVIDDPTIFNEDAMNELPAGTIEVGAADNDYRLWAAKEAQRQAELALASQAANLLAAETRATSLVGWTVAGALAGMAVLTGHPNAHEHVVLAAIGAPVIVAIGACVAALWPKLWHRPGTDLAWLLETQTPDDCELRTLEAMAAGHIAAVEKNDRRLKAFSNKMKIAWIAFLAIPLVAVGVSLFFS